MVRILAYGDLKSTYNMICGNNIPLWGIVMFGETTVLRRMVNGETNCMLKVKQNCAFPVPSVKFEAFSKETTSSNQYKTLYVME